MIDRNVKLPRSSVVVLNDWLDFSGDADGVISTVTLLNGLREMPSMTTPLTCVPGSAREVCVSAQGGKRDRTRRIPLRRAAGTKRPLTGICLVADLMAAASGFNMVAGPVED